MAYLWLAAAGLVPAAWLIWRRNDGHLLALYFMAGNLVMTADLVALGILQLYEYRPGIFRHPIAEQALGVMCAEAAAVSGMVVILAALAPDWRGVGVGAGILLALEILFLRLGLFVHHGWQIWHTAVGFSIYLAVLFWLWRVGWPKWLLRFSIAGWWWHNASMVVTWAWPALVMPVPLLPKFYPNQVLMATLTSGPIVLASTMWVMSAPGARLWKRALLAAAGILVMDLFWVATGVWQFRAPYSLIWHYALQLGMVALSVLTEAWIKSLTPFAAPTTV